MRSSCSCPCSLLAAAELVDAAMRSDGLGSERSTVRLPAALGQLQSTLIYTLYYHAVHVNMKRTGGVLWVLKG